MGHIHSSQGHHDVTVSAFVVLLTSNDEPRVLLHRHKKLGLWFQPGGHVELHENPWQAIAHELEEETGYSLHELSVLQGTDPLVELQEVSHPIPLLYRSHRYIGAEPAHYHTDATFGFIARTKPKALPAAGESQELGWFTDEELDQLPNEVIHPDIRAVAKALLEKFESYLEVPVQSFSLEHPRLQELVSSTPAE